MRVKVKLHATLRKFLPAGGDGEGMTIEINDGATVGQVIERLGIPAKHAGMLVSGEEFLEVTSVLAEGQELSIFPPMAGGTWGSAAPGARAGRGGQWRRGRVGRRSYGPMKSRQAHETKGV